MKRFLTPSIFALLIAQFISCAGQTSNDETKVPAGGNLARCESLKDRAGSNSDGQLLAAKAKILQGKYQESIRELETLRGSTLEEQATKLILIGQCYEALPDISRAFAAYRQAQSTAPGVHSAILREGVLCLKNEDLEMGQRLLKKYIQLEAGNPEAFYYLWLYETNREKRGIYLRRVLILDEPGGSWAKRILKDLDFQK